MCIFFLVLLFKRPFLIVIWITTDLRVHSSLRECLLSLLTKTILMWQALTLTAHISEDTYLVIFHLLTQFIETRLLQCSLTNISHFHFTTQFIYSASRQGLLLLLLLFTKCRIRLLINTVFFTKHYFNDIVNPNKLFRYNFKIIRNEKI